MCFESIKIKEKKKIVINKLLKNQSNTSSIRYYFLMAKLKYFVFEQPFFKPRPDADSRLLSDFSTCKKSAKIEKRMEIFEFQSMQQHRGNIFRQNIYWQFFFFCS